MFEHDNISEFDLQMRSILEGGQEEVPAGLWRGVSAGLDKAARRRKASLWFRYSGIAVATAAAIAVGVVFNHGTDSDLVPAEGSEGLIAVVENTDTNSEMMQEDAPEVIRKAPAESLIAMADVKMSHDDGLAAQTEDAQAVDDAQTEAEAETKDETTSDVAETTISPTPVTSMTNETGWVDEPEKKRINTSLVICDKNGGCERLRYSHRLPFGINPKRSTK
jgi:hypothetical protein